MLVYFKHGERRYTTAPVGPHARRGCEFQAVLRGAIAPVFPGVPPTPHRRSLWAFAPGDMHGWTGDSRPAVIAVWHFTSTPRTLHETLQHAGPQRVNLTPADTARLTRLAHQTAEHFPRVTRLTERVGDLVLAQLRWLLARELDIDTAEPQANRDEYANRTVERAVAWYRENLERPASVAEAADALAISEPHLRRLFKAAGRASPKQVLDAVRFEEADRLLRQTPLKLAVIADRLGFSGPEAFSRAYRAAKGVPPGVARRHR